MGKVESNRPQERVFCSRLNLRVSGRRKGYSVHGMSFQDEKAHQGPPSPYPVLQQPPGQGLAPPIIQTSPRILFGPDSVTTVCPNCQANITTDTKSEVGVFAAVAAGSLCAMGFCGILCWLCAPIPLCMGSLKDVTHSCPNCHALVGKYRAKIN